MNYVVLGGGEEGDGDDHSDEDILKTIDFVVESVVLEFVLSGLSEDPFREHCLISRRTNLRLDQGQSRNLCQ